MQVVTSPEVIWTVPEGGKFLKGLCVIDDISFIGVSPFGPRETRQNPTADSEVAAFDLIARKLWWRRTVPTR